MKNIFLAIILLGFSGYSFSQCLEDTHTPFGEDAWLSCSTSDNPNPVRPAGHWIMFDLGFEYVLDSSHIWNYNAWGGADAGIQEAVIDYSLDGVNWISLDTFVIDQASASYKYEGVPGPIFGEVPARYVLLTALSNWGNPSCTGLSEIRFGLSNVVDTEEPILEDRSLTVSPNPVDQVANISIQSLDIPEHVALYDLSGKLLMFKDELIVKNVSFNVQNLPSGVYFVKAKVGEEILTEKLVKQ